MSAMVFIELAPNDESMPPRVKDLAMNVQGPIILNYYIVVNSILKDPKTNAQFSSSSRREHYWPRCLSSYLTTIWYFPCANVVYLSKISR